MFLCYDEADFRKGRYFTMKKFVVLFVILALVLACPAFAEETAKALPEDYFGDYYTFEDSGVAMKLPADYKTPDREAAPTVVFEASHDDVFLQVSVLDEKFADRDALMEYYNGLEYVIRATQLEINGVELVYAEGADDDAMVYAVIGPEGTTYQFVFLPQNENSLAVIEAMTQSIRPSETLAD